MNQNNTTCQVDAPLDVFSVHFDFPGGDAISLRDVALDQHLGDTPEWINGVRNEFAAFVRGVRPRVRVVLLGPRGTSGNYTIEARGGLLQVNPRAVTLNFDHLNGQSAPVVLETVASLPDRVGIHYADMEWHAAPEGRPTGRPIGTTSHRIGTTWRAMRPNWSQELEAWTYKPLMEWTCEWAAGKDDEKAICDAIIGGIKVSNLRYGTPSRVRDVRNFLLNAGGMCGEWYLAFQQMAHCQGVFVYRRAFLVDWRTQSRGEETWCALVIRRGGLNQIAPTHPESGFHDNDTIYPIQAPVPLTHLRERRYQFFGCPNYWYDGHCINYLVHGERAYLYDACFGIGPIEIDAPLPEPNLIPQGGAALDSFKARYLDNAVDHMLGSLWNGADFFKCSHRAPGHPGPNGVTVKTRNIPEVAHGEPGLTFRWSE